MMATCSHPNRDGVACAGVALSVRGLSVSYDRAPVVEDVSFDVAPGSSVALVGPNGAGKSTVLKAILGLVRPHAGSVCVFGAPYAAHALRVAYVPQRDSVDWEFPVRVVDVVAMGLYRSIGWLRSVLGRHRAEAMAALEQVGLADLARRPIDELSGGQQQRVFLARAIVQQPDLFLMDEPFAGVDAESEALILERLEGLRAEGRSAVVVHHDLATVARHFERVILLHRTVIADGAPRDVLVRPTLQAAYGDRLLFLDAHDEAPVTSGSR